MSEHKIERSDKPKAPTTARGSRSLIARKQTPTRQPFYVELDGKMIKKSHNPIGGLTIRSGRVEINEGLPRRGHRP